MRVIGVLDLLAGRAVHAQAGQREHYAPVRVAAGIPIESGDPLALARAYTGRLGLTELYAADLDSIMGAPLQNALVAGIASAGAALWLDAGAFSVERARQALALGAGQVVVGLETLRSRDALVEICDALGRDRVAFSLDLRNGSPVTAGTSMSVLATVPALAVWAVEAGVGSVIVIDLARVGKSQGIDLVVIEQVRRLYPDVTLIAGGGVRDPGDLARLADAGCDGVLVATALHNGRIGAADVAAAREWGRGNHPRPSR